VELVPLKRRHCGVRLDRARRVRPPPPANVAVEGSFIYFNFLMWDTVQTTVIKTTMVVPVSMHLPRASDVSATNSNFLVRQ
jgi:hypothetical protein